MIIDDFTPHGYLDNPWHSAVHPSGVIRCQPAIGFGWHFPGRSGPYLRQWLYRAALRLAPVYDGRPLLTPQDFDAAGIALVSALHSKDIISFDWQLDGLVCRTTFFIAAENALCCQITLENRTSTPRSFRCAFVAEYERNVGTGLTWDEGVSARLPTGGEAELAAFPEGEAFCLSNDLLSVARSVGTGIPASTMHLGSDTPPGTFASDFGSGARGVHAVLVCEKIVPRGQSVAVLAVLGRGQTTDSARTAARRYLSSVPNALARHVEVAEAFQSGCPRLSGDWPAHWRRGLIYDLETVRMVLRPPAGQFRYHWDGMQINSPRLVLAEAALDALILSYAAPEAALEALLNAFRNVTAPNVPCSRENGTHNMIAEDGEACGTAPEWCFPFHCADLLHRRCGDARWLAQIYPHLSRYLNWWLDHRTDDEGWLHYHCSWESGQDDSPRFGSQRTGGSPIHHIRPVDLHAAMTQAAAILAGFAEELGKTRDADRWRRLSERYAGMTRSLWHDDWFHDYDAIEGIPVPFRDVMHLAPLLAAAASADQQATLRPAFDHLPPHGRWPSLDWPPVAFTAIESASAAGWHGVAGELAAHLADRVYRLTDNRTWSPGAPLPGIASEFWSSVGSWGSEGYGWGAACALFVIRHVAGWQEGCVGAIELFPALPDSWLAPGKRFSVGSLHHRGRDFALSYFCAEDSLLVELDVPMEVEPIVRDVDGKRLQTVRDGRTVSFRGANHASFRVELR